MMCSPWYWDYWPDMDPDMIAADTKNTSGDTGNYCQVMGNTA